MEWIADLSRDGKTYHAVKNRFTALRSWHVDLGLDTSAFRDDRVRRTLRGFKRLHGISARGQKLPITLPVLNGLVDSLRTLPLLPTRDKATFHCAFTLAYACFLRCAEFTWSTFDPSSTLCVGDVRWSTDFAEVRLPCSKTDPFGQGVDLVVPRTRSPVCPYAALQAICNGRPAQAPLFALGDGSTPFSRSRFLSVLCLLLQRLGLPADKYAGHSFRRGAASWASFVGAPDSVVQTLGRWSSDCFKRYIDKPTAEKSRLSSVFVFGSLASRRENVTTPVGL